MIGYGANSIVWDGKDFVPQILYGVGQLSAGTNEWDMCPKGEKGIGVDVLGSIQSISNVLQVSGNRTHILNTEKALRVA